MTEAAFGRLAALPAVSLLGGPSPVEELSRLRDALGGGPRLFVKRDDAIPFGFGGNKTRKLELVAAAALAEGADVLVTCGGVQSNHVRATAAVATKLGLACHVVTNGSPPAHPTGNALLTRLLGAGLEYVPGREDRPPGMEAAVERLRRAGRKPYLIPLGASTPLGALGFVRAVGELIAHMAPPDVIIHSCSSGGTQAGLIAGCALHGLKTRVIGISADDPAAEIGTRIHAIVAGIGRLLGAERILDAAAPIVVDDGFVGSGYAEPTPASIEAQELGARSEALFVDHAYTAKALAGLIAYWRAGRFGADESVVFWHTGGQPGLFA